MIPYTLHENSAMLIVNHSLETVQITHFLFSAYFISTPDAPLSIPR